MNFEEYKTEKELIKFSDHKLGTLYFTAFKPSETQILVRRFDGNLLPAYVPAFEKCINACKEFIQKDSALSNLVEVETLLETGEGFIVRKWHGNSESIQSYYDEYEPVEPPSQWHEIKDRFKAFETLEFSEEQKHVIRILYNSLIEENYNTFFLWDDDCFIISEPIVSVEDVLFWHS